MNFKKTKKYKYMDKIQRSHLYEKFLKKEVFNKMNPVFFTRSDNFNKSQIWKKKQYKNKNEIVGTILESGFLNSRKSFFNIYDKEKLKVEKIKKIIKKGKVKDSKLRKLSYRLSNNLSSIIFAGAGSWKSQNIVYPSIIANSLSPSKPNMIITDPKGDVLEATYVSLIENGYEVKVLNFIDPNHTDSISPFENLKNEMIEFIKNNPNKIDYLDQKNNDISTRIDEEVIYLSFAISKDEGNAFNDSFWEENARRLFSIILWFIIDDLIFNFYKYKNLDKFKKELIKINFNSIVSTLDKIDAKKYYSFYLENGIDLSNNVSKRMQNIQLIHKGLAKYSAIFGNEEAGQSLEKLFLQVKASLNANMQSFENEAMIKTSIISSFYLTDFVDPNKQIALFFSIPSTKQHLLPYISFLINYMQNWLSVFAGKQQDKKLPKPIYFMLEELGNLPKINTLPNVINEGRSKNLVACLIFQSVAQYQSIYGKHSGKDLGIINSSEYVIALGNRDEKFNELFHGLGGKYLEKNPKFNSKHPLPNIERFIEKERLDPEEFVSVVDGEALIIQKKQPIPYKATFIPFFIHKESYIETNEIPTLKNNKLNPYEYIHNPLFSEEIEKENINKEYVFKPFKFTKKPLWNFLYMSPKELNEINKFLNDMQQNEMINIEILGKLCSFINDSFYLNENQEIIINEQKYSLNFTNEESLLKIYNIIFKSVEKIKNSFTKKNILGKYEDKMFDKNLVSKYLKYKKAIDSIFLYSKTSSTKEKAEKNISEILISKSEIRKYFKEFIELEIFSEEEYENFKKIIEFF